MLLKMKDLTNEINYQCKFEKVVEDLVMITIESEIDIVRIMSYWRLTGVEDTPPLEIGINCDNTQISRIVFFVDLYTLKTGKHINETETIKGNVQVDVSVFSKLYEFIDIDKSYEMHIYDNSIICVFDKELVKKVNTGRLDIYLNSLNEIVGIGINNLSEEEIRLFNLH